MLVKLLKYDLKYMIKNMFIFYVLSLFFAITSRILLNIEQSVIINIIGKISLGCMISMLFNILINTMIRSWVRFRDSLYKDESYLTHTLPVTKNDLYNSKFIQTFIFFFVSFVVILISLFITLSVYQEAIIKDLAAKIQTDIKEAVKKSLDLEIKEVNIRVKNINQKKETAVKE